MSQMFTDQSNWYNMVFIWRMYVRKYRQIFYSPSFPYSGLHNVKFSSWRLGENRERYLATEWDWGKLDQF